ncbi:MAG: hypothetical protein QOH49_4211 [Acidobacteriota bacterium]|nr:hypothetical protein [Acidobacteriota bacterium]
MGDECNCDKCQSGSMSEPGLTMWPVVRAEAPADGRGRSQRNLYLVVTDGGISLRQQSYEM